MGREAGTDADWTGEEITCEVAWMLIQGFVSGDSTPDGERLMRAHTTVCGECRDEYRSAIATAARIGGEHRRKRIAEERERRHRDLRRAAFEATAPSAGRFHRMRTLLYPAFFAFLMFQVSRLTLAVEGVSITRLAGEVRVAESALEPGVEQRVGRGEWCETGADASARLGTSTCSATLGGHSSLLVERARPARFRLTRGELELDGTCTVSTEWGVVDLAPGSARITVAGEGLAVACRGGEVTLTGPSGAERIGVGEARRFSHGGP